MLRRTACLGLIAAGLVPVLPAAAAGPATPEEAKLLVEKAVAHFNAGGPEKAIADFNDPGGAFIDRELFVVVYAPDNKIVGGIGVPALLGKDATTLKDVEGRFFGKEIIDLARSQGQGWVDYRMSNPLTRKVGLKTSYVTAAGGYVLFVGAFKN